VVDLLIARHAADAADVAQSHRAARAFLLVGRVVGSRLNDADEPVARHHVVEHFEIAWLKHVQR
jgi:hypothetical protein